MKYAILSIISVVLCHAGGVFAQVTDTSVQWAWIKGSTSSNQNGTYGTQGTPDPANTPGTRVVSMIWQDKQGKFWMMGGEGRGASGTTNYRLNDLWKYDPATGDWVWLKGTNTPPQAGVYGTAGVPAAANVPGGRSHAGTWIDTAGNLWLYGGIGYSTSTAATPRLNDLWKYNPATNEWTWIKGSQGTTAVAATWGTQGVSAPANNPGSRSHVVTWIDKDNKLWLFGGYHQAAPAGYLNDLWRFDPLTNEWTWMKGSNSTATPVSVYGTQGAEGPAVTPGGLSSAVGWLDTDGNFWMYGGYGHASATTANNLGTMWKYNHATNNWTYVQGATVTTPGAVYGTQGVSDPANTPGGANGAYGWKDVQGNFWLFGGYHPSTNNFRSDLWKYNPVINEWTWMKGPGTIDEVAVYGTQGTPDPANTPGARFNIAIGRGWVDTAGNFWIFGGSPRTVMKNDLWRLAPVVPPVCVIPMPVIAAAGSTTFCQGDSVVLRCTTPGGGLSYRWLEGGNVLTGETDDSLVVYTPGSFSVEIFNGTCADTSVATDITVHTLPGAGISATGPAAFCDGDSVVLTATPSGAGFTYQWLKDGANTGNNTNIFMASLSGLYRVVVTNSNNCSDTAAGTTVIVHPLPVVNITVSGPVSFCQGDSVTINAGTGSGWSYGWKRDNTPVGGNTATHTATATGTYHVTVTDGNNCWDTASQMVQVYTRPSLSVTPADTAFCEGGSVLLQSVTADTGLSYQWKDDNGIINNATSAFLQVTQSGNYYIVAGSQHAGNCTDSSAIATVTVHPLPEPVIDWDGNELSTQPGYESYQWYIDGQVIIGATDSVWRAVNGDYVVEVTDSNGCTNMSDIFTVTNAGFAGNDALVRLIKVYPNPVTAGVIHILSPVTVQVMLMSMDGRLLMQQRDAMTIDISRFPDGVYMLRIMDEESHFIRHERVVKKVF